MAAESLNEKKEQKLRKEEESGKNQETYFSYRSLSDEVVYVILKHN